MDDAEKLALVKRYVEDPSLSSDGSLRANIAQIMGWRIDGSYYQDTMFLRLRLQQRLKELEDSVYD